MVLCCEYSILASHSQAASVETSARPRAGLYIASASGSTGNESFPPSRMQHCPETIPYTYNVLSGCL